MKRLLALLFLAAGCCSTPSQEVPFNKQVLLQETVQKLVIGAPPRRPVYVQIADLSKYDHDGISYAGICAETSTGWVITVDDDLTRGELVETVIHEWAHVLRSSQAGPVGTRGHDDYWGLAYSQAYRAVFGNKPVLSI